MRKTSSFLEAFERAGKGPVGGVALLLTTRERGGTHAASAQADRVRDWLRANTQATPDFVADVDRLIPADDRAPCERLEADAYWLAHVLDEFKPQTDWDRESAMKRLDRTKRIERLAEDLAAEIEAVGTPEYGDVMDCVDPAFRAAVVAALAAQSTVPITAHQSVIETVAAQGGIPPAEQRPEGAGLAYVFRHSPQPWPEVLRRLAEIPRRTRQAERRTGKPNVSPADADARVLARRLRDHFEKWFEKVPRPIVADCIALRLPGLVPAPNSKSVTNWLRSKVARAEDVRSGAPEQKGTVKNRRGRPPRKGATPAPD